MTLFELAARLGLECRGDDIELKGIGTLEHAGPSELSFLANPKYAEFLPKTQAGAVIVHPEYADKVQRALISMQPYQDFGRALQLFAKKKGVFQGVSPLAFIHPDAKIGENATIYPFACIESGVVIDDNVVIYSGCYLGPGVHVGSRSVLYPNVVLMDDTHIGEGVIIHAGAVLGADGFGFSKTEAGIEKIPQTGNVQIGRNVEIGANTAIDRAVLDSTTVGDGTKIDNLVQLGHNVRVGKNTFIVSQVGISGSTHIGDGCTLAGQVGVAGHLHIGNNVTIGPQSGVAKDIADSSTVGGSPAVDYATFMKTLALMPKYPDIFKRLSKLEKALAALEAEQNEKEKA